MARDLNLNPDLRRADQPPVETPQTFGQKLLAALRDGRA